jgi:hypothetical protein
LDAAGLRLIVLLILDTETPVVVTVLFLVRVLYVVGVPLLVVNVVTLSTVVKVDLGQLFKLFKTFVVLYNR